MWLYQFVLALSLGIFSAPAPSLSLPQCVEARGYPRHLKNCQASVTVYVKVSEKIIEKDGEGEKVIKSTNAGSGVVLSEDGYILTDAHVIGKTPPDSIHVRYETCAGKVDSAMASLISIDHTVGVDLALLKTAQRFSETVRLGWDNGLRYGDPAYMIATPFGILHHSFIKSYIGNWDSRDNTIMLGNSVVPGSSGGGVYDRRGLLIGLLQASNPVFSYAIPIRTIRSFLNKSPFRERLK